MFKPIGRSQFTPFDVLLTALCIVAALLIVAVFAHGAPVTSQTTVKVIYLDPGTIARVDAAALAKREAEAAWDAVEKEIGAQFAQEVDAKPASNGVIISDSSKWATFTSNYWQDAGPRPPSPAEDHHWLNGWEWGFQFLSDFSGIVPAPPPVDKTKQSANIQLFRQ